MCFSVVVFFCQESKHYQVDCSTGKVLVTQLCPTLCNPMDYSPPGSSVHEISQARILEWVAIPFSRGSSQTRDGIWVSGIAGGFFTIWAAREDSLTKGNFLKRLPWGRKRGHFLIFQLLRNFQKLTCLLVSLALINYKGAVSLKSYFVMWEQLDFLLIMGKITGD